MNLKRELQNRGFVHQTAGGELDDIFKERRTFYLGIDPSSDSLQVGNLGPLMLARRLARAGNTAIILIGGATGQIGDPGGKQSERVLQDKGVIAKNAKAQIKQVQKLLGTRDFAVVNNAEWLERLNLLDFFREVGKHFTINSLVKREYIKERLEGEENSISYTEFSYALLQAYDYYHLYKRYGCNLQISGSDQWGNIVSGIELIRKKEEAQVFGLTMPLVTDASGKKFGKSEGNAVWLDPKKTTPFAFYQFWFNTTDAEVEKLLNIYTDLSHEAIRDLVESNPQERKAQKALAQEVTALVHGKKSAESAQNASEVLFSGNIEGITSETKKMLLDDAPHTEVSLKTSILDALLESKLVHSKGEGRRLIDAGGITIQGEKVSSTDALFDTTHFTNKISILKKGKKDVVILTLK